MADLPQLPSPVDADFSGESGQAPAENKESIFVGILETLQQNNFLLMNLSESTDVIEENTEDDESQTERRNRRINEENTDKPGAFSRAIGGLGAGVKGVGGILNKANPFQEGGLGTKMSILLISGVLFAISKFGDKLVKPLAEVLEMFDSEGGVLEKLKNTDLFKGVVETFEKIGADISERFETFSTDIKAKFETIGTDIETAFADAKTSFEAMGETIKTMGDDIGKLLESVTLVGGYVKDAYDTIMAYINQFDTRGSGPRNEYGDGKLDAFEFQNLKDDLNKKLTDYVFKFVDTISSAIFLGLGSFLTYGIIASYLKGAAYRAGLGDDPDKKNKDNKTNKNNKPSAEGPKRRFARGALTRAASLFTISSGATASTIGGSATTALDRPGTRLNSAGRLINAGTGRYVATHKGKTFSLQHLAKYPKLLAIARKAPFLLPFIAGGQALEIFNNPNNTHDDKVEGIGGILGGTGASLALGKLGALLGTMALPGWGTVSGAILGATGGYFVGEEAGRMLARFMMGEAPEMPKLLRDLGNLGSILNPAEPPGTVAGPMINEYENNAGVNDQYYEGEVPKMSILSASTGEYPQASFVSRLDGNLMNKNTDLALAAYEADKAKKLKATTGVNDKYYDANDVPKMEIITDNSTKQNFSTVSSNSLSVDDTSTSARLLSSGAYATLGLDFLKAQ